MNAERVPEEVAFGFCGWCGKKLRAVKGSHGFTFRKPQGLDLSEHEGSAILLSLATMEKKVICVISSPDSSARAEGKDFLFLLCSKKCAKRIEAAMDEEVTLWQIMIADVEKMKN